MGDCDHSYTCYLVQCVSILLITEESSVTVTVLHTSGLSIAAGLVGAVTLPEAAVVLGQVLGGVYREEVGGEDVGVGACV